MADIVTTEITASALVVYLLELLKKASWCPWISRSSDVLNRIVAGILAVATGLGIHAKFDDGTLVITGLTLTSAAHFGVVWLRSFVFQEMIYKGVIKPRVVNTSQVDTSIVEAGRRVQKTVVQPQSQAANA